MSFQVMLQQLTTGFGSYAADLFSDLYCFSLPLGHGSIFRKSKPFQAIKLDRESLYFYYERNTADAAAACCGISDRFISGE